MRSVEQESKSKSKASGGGTDAYSHEGPHENAGGATNGVGVVQKT